MRIRKKFAAISTLCLLTLMGLLWKRSLLVDFDLSMLYTRYPSNVTYVLIVTYMRSGSSLIGDILQQSPGALYVFEPLRRLNTDAEQAVVYNKASLTVFYINGSQSTISTYGDYYAMKINILHHWFTRQITKLPWQLINDAFLAKGNKTRQFSECMATTNHDAIAEMKCIRQLEDACRASPVRIIKTIRMKLIKAKELFELLPNFKIVHLVRDPRATLHSQEGLSECIPRKGGRFGCTTRFCNRLHSDLIQEMMISDLYPSGIKTVFYENIAYNPIDTSKRVYNFIGTTFTTAAEEYVNSLTQPGANDSCFTCTVRSNSTEHVHEWEKKMDRSFVELVQQRCKRALLHYRYKFRPTANVDLSEP